MLNIIKHLIPIYLLIIALIMLIYIALSILRSKRRIAILDNDCDPEAFWEKTVKQASVTGRNPKMAVYFAINEAAAYITMGRFQEAGIILEDVDRRYLSDRNNTLLIYTMNRIICCYELGKTDEAERLFVRQLTVLPALSRDLRDAIRVLIGERYFFLGKYDESREYFNKLLKNPLSKRKRLDIQYRLAQIDEIKNDTEDAISKYTEVVQQGNKLWIAKQAAERLKELTGAKG